VEDGSECHLDREKGAFRPLSYFAYLPAQPQLPHLQQRHSTHLQSTHLQQAQAFVSTLAAFMVVLLDDGGMPWR
jgi:hypothetical protein